MSHPSGSSADLGGRIVATVALIWLLIEFPAPAYGPDWQTWLWWGGAAVALAGVINIAFSVFGR